MRRLLTLLTLTACAATPPAPQSPAPQSPAPQTPALQTPALQARPAPVPALRPADAPPMVWADLTSRPRPSPTVESTRLEEDGTEALRGDLWMPDGPGPFPVVLMIHGGCWQKAIADHALMDWAAADLARRGYAVWNVEYRGVDEAPYPAIFADIREAADYLALLGEQLSRLDTDRTVALGHSAGGHLALWLAGSAQLPGGHPGSTGEVPPLRGVVSTGGLQDLEAAEPITLPSCLADIKDALTGPATPERPDPYADTSPARLLPLGVPQVAIHADRDRIAPVALGEAWVARAQAAGDEARLVTVPGGHVELIAPGTHAWEATVAEIERLLRH